MGATLYISVPECGIQGDATLLQIEACPPIAKSPGPGFQIVTGTFHHQAAKTLDIAVEGESKPIGTTPNHPFWSVDREAFVRADSLTVGERLQNLNGITTVKSISPRGPPEPVYNLEVQVKHTYYVADSGVLVHNGKDCVPTHPNSKDFVGPNHGYAIFNKKTGEVYKFGVGSGAGRKGFTATGQSKRARSQLTKLAKKNSVPRSELDTIKLTDFPNRSDAYSWEKEMVTVFRKLDHELPDNLRPKPHSH